MVQNFKSQLPVYGYYDHGNAGDEAFKLAFDQAFGNVPHRYIAHMHSEPLKPNTLILGGGAIVNDYFLSNIHGVEKIHIIGCSLPWSDEDVERLEFIRPNIRQLVFRSKNDVYALKKAGFDAVFCPDIVFSIRPQSNFSVNDLTKFAELIPDNFSDNRKKLFVFLSDNYLPDQNASANDSKELYLLFERASAHLITALDALSDEFDIILPSMSVWYNARDYLFAGYIVRRMKMLNKVCLIEHYVSPEKLLSAINSCDCVVMSMKYHGLVFGAMAKKFIVNIGNTRKNNDLMNDMGLGGLTCDYTQLTADSLIETIRKHTRTDLLERIFNVSDDWHINSKNMLSEAISMAVEDHFQ